MPESKSSRWIALSELSHIAAVVAPSAVAVTALLYLTGHVERVSRLGPYGRHRFAWLRDHGVRAMPMQVSPDEANWFAEQIGTLLRVSILPAR